MSKTPHTSMPLRERLVKRFAPSDDPVQTQIRMRGFHILALITAILGLNYIIWRWTASLNLNALWFAIPLALAETYSMLDTFLLIFMMWKPPRNTTPAPPAAARVDIFIATYNEPIELVRLTADAAMRIDWDDKHVYILDDSARAEMRLTAQEVGCAYITRGEEWSGKPLHAKAGNINNALLQTSGEFILILDADQIPTPVILKRTLGYFSDALVAFVQTPQYFYNLPPGDPFGSDAPLFYGPIQQGKDGWNAAFFCGSNAVLRREALMQLGLTNYVHEMEEQMQQSMTHLTQEVRRFKVNSPLKRSAQTRLKQNLREAHQSLKQGDSLESVSDTIRRAVLEAEQTIALQDLREITLALKELAAQGDESAEQARDHITEHMHALAQQTAPSEPEAIGVSAETLEGINLTPTGEAIPVSALATISITEDMATAMRLHALGWRSVFHHEILAYGLAPEDLGSALKQRLRWAQGTLQVFLRENPLRIKGLTWPQRLLYFTTMYSYFSGFFNLIYLLAPIIFLFTQISPLDAWSAEFLWRLIPFLILNKLMFRYVAWGMSVWRGEQYNLGLFSLWIQAVVSVFIGAKISFAVTPKQRQSGNYLNLVWPQLLIVGLTLVAIIYGVLSLLAGSDLIIQGSVINAIWGVYNIIMLSAIVKAAIYKPPSDWEARPPEFLFPRGASENIGD